MIVLLDRATGRLGGLGKAEAVEEVPDPTVVIVPGGGPPTIRAMGDEAIRDYLRQVAGTAHVVGSVCAGAMLLAAAACTCPTAQTWA